MSIRTKIKAFTLTEVIVVMVISSLVIISGYVAYRVINMQMSLYKRNSELFVTAHDFNSTFTKDIFTSNYIYRKENDLLILASDTIIYSFYKDQIIRKIRDNSDTIRLQVKDFSASFQGVPTQKGFVDYVQLNLVLAGDFYPFYYHKSYSSYNLYDLNKYEAFNSDFRED